MTRDMEKNPYSEQEQRVADYLNELAGIGGGDDPIGFLTACHGYLAGLARGQKERIEALTGEKEVHPSFLQMDKLLD